MKTPTTTWTTPEEQQLLTVLSGFTASADLKDFLTDVMTQSEITEIAARLEAARLLDIGTKYTDIENSTTLSSRTIARISKWIKQGTGGYKKAFTIIETHASHN